MTLSGKVLSLCVAVLAVAGCGLPSGGAAQPIPPEEVPYHLLADGTRAPSSTSPRHSSTGPQVYWVDGGALVAVDPPTTDADDDTDALAEVLRALAAGPDAEQQASGLSSALGAGVGITLVGIDRGVAEIEVAFAAQEPSADRLPLAIGQIVLTAISAPTVSRVQVVDGGEPVSVPLPSGVLVDEPLTVDDYAELMARR